MESPITEQNKFTKLHNIIAGVQHREARFVVHNYSWETYGSTLASALSWPTLEQRRAEARLTTMYKITNNLLDMSPNQYLMPGHSQTRSNLPQLLQIQLFSRTIAQCNRLPSNVFAHNSLDTFKGALQDINLTIAPLPPSGTSNKQYTPPPRPLHTPIPTTPPPLICTFPHPPHPNPIFPSRNTLIPLPDNMKPAILKPSNHTSA